MTSGIAARLSGMNRAVGWLASNTGSLTSRVLRGGMWLFAGNMFNRAAGLLKIAILGRLLAPSDFGLMGIAMLALQWVEFFSQSGFNTALIRKDGDPRPYFNTVWTVQIVRGTLLAATLALAAPLAAAFFHNPSAVPLVRLTALVLFFRGLNSPAIICLRRDLNFRREMVWRLWGTLTGLATAVVIALVYRNVWALAFAVVAGQAVETALSYWAEPYWPRLAWNRAQIRELMGFGKWVFWSNMLMFVCTYLDSTSVGKLLGGTALGFYEVATQIALSPTYQVGVYVRGLMLPTFRQLSPGEDLRRGFLRTFRLLFLVVIPASAFLSAFALPIIRLVVGDRWISIAPVVEILAWTGAANALSEVTGPMLLRLDKPRLITIGYAQRAGLLAGLMYPLIRLAGATGVAWTTLIAAVVSLAYLMIVVSQHLGVTWRDWKNACSDGLLASAPLLAAWILVGRTWSVSTIVVGGGAILISCGMVARACGVLQKIAGLRTQTMGAA